jgi:hypothetical protein
MINRRPAVTPCRRHASYERDRMNVLALFWKGACLDDLGIYTLWT